jgi:hypothetical protein
VLESVISICTSVRSGREVEARYRFKLRYAHLIELMQVGSAVALLLKTLGQSIEVLLYQDDPLGYICDAQQTGFATYPTVDGEPPKLIGLVSMEFEVLRPV